MKVLMQGRRDLFEFYGGDSTQVLRTKEYLEKLNVGVDVSTEFRLDVGKYDLVHIFNAPFGDTYSMVKNAKGQGKKVVLSPVYLDYSEYDKKGRGGLPGFVCNLLNKYRAEDFKAVSGIVRRRKTLRDISSLIKGYRRIQNEILRSVDFLLPNSESEMERLRRDFSVGDRPYLVVPYAVDKIFLGETPKIEKGLERFNGCLMSVARIEGRKNQLNLVRAVKGLPYSLVLIGRVAQDQYLYFRQIQRESGANVHFLGPIKHEDMPKYYKLAKVHCLASWMETCGLSSMEAAAMGCNIVITNNGDTREYYGEYASYCEPGSIESIRNAILRSYDKSSDVAFKKHIAENYTWEKAAEQTLKAYKILLNN